MQYICLTLCKCIISFVKVSAALKLHIFETLPILVTAFHLPIHSMISIQHILSNVSYYTLTSCDNSITSWTYAAEHTVGLICICAFVFFSSMYVSLLVENLFLLLTSLHWMASLSCSSITACSFLEEYNQSDNFPNLSTTTHLLASFFFTDDWMDEIA